MRRGSKIKPFRLVSPFFLQCAQFVSCAERTKKLDLGSLADVH